MKIRQSVINIVIHACIYVHVVELCQRSRYVRDDVLFSELNMLKLGTSCVVCNYTLGRMWT